MKILFCYKCFSFHSFSEKWTFCDCKQMTAHWVDPQKGTVEVLALVPEKARIIGVNNSFLRMAFVGSKEDGNPPKTNDDWKIIHNLATVAPGYIFDFHKRACWACIMKVGETSDIFWHKNQTKLNSGELNSIQEAIDYKDTQPE